MTLTRNNKSLSDVIRSANWNIGQELLKQIKAQKLSRHGFGDKVSSRIGLAPSTAASLVSSMCKGYNSPFYAEEDTCLNLDKQVSRFYTILETAGVDIHNNPNIDILCDNNSHFSKLRPTCQSTPMVRESDDAVRPYTREQRYKLPLCDQSVLFAERIFERTQKISTPRKFREFASKKIAFYERRAHLPDY